MPAYMRTPLTAEQAEDMRACLYEWLTIRQDNGRPPTVTAADVVKSCLLGRMTLDGKPALPDPPPTAYSAPWYSLIEEGRATLAEFDIDGPHLMPGSIYSYMLVRQHPWAVVEEVTGGWLVRCAEVDVAWLLRRVAGEPETWELLGPTHYYKNRPPSASSLGEPQTPTSSLSSESTEDAGANR